MPSHTDDSPADFHRLSLFLARRTGDADYAQELAMDAFRWAQSQTQEGIDVPFGALLAASHARRPQPSGRGTMRLHSRNPSPGSSHPSAPWSAKC